MKWNIKMWIHFRFTLNTIFKYLNKILTIFNSICLNMINNNILNNNIKKIMNKKYSNKIR